MSLALKEAVVDRLTRNRKREVAVAYVVEDNEVFFGIKGRRLSEQETANAVRLAIQLICEREELDSRRHVFFEVQTHRGYGRLRSGYFEIQRVELEPRLTTGKRVIRILECLKILPTTHRPTTAKALKNLGDLIPHKLIDAFAPIIV